MKAKIITVEDVANVLGINLAADLGLQPQGVDYWLWEKQEVILNYIANYRYGGRPAVERLLNDSAVVETIKQAIIAHISYLKRNNYVEPNNVMDTGKGTPVQPAIAPLAHQLLQNAGLLYTGSDRGCYGI